MKLADLAKEFPKEAVHWRVQGTPYERNGAYSAMALAYIDARDVQNRLDEVCGPEAWQSALEESPSGRVFCKIGIHVVDQWVWKTDGAGGTAVEADKGGISDAFKRAGVCWGIGRYLYSMPSPWVPCEVRIKDGKPYLNNGKAVWKKWKVDPWSLVKRPITKSEQPEPKAEPTARDKADWIIASYAKADTADRLTNFDTRPDVEALIASLPEPMQAEIKTAYRKAFDALTPIDNERAGETAGEILGGGVRFQ